MISVSHLIRDNVPVWRSSNDIVLTQGHQGRVPAHYIMQMIGVKLRVRSTRYELDGGNEPLLHQLCHRRVRPHRDAISRNLASAVRGPSVVRQGAEHGQQCAG